SSGEGAGAIRAPRAPPTPQAARRHRPHAIRPNRSLDLSFTTTTGTPPATPSNATEANAPDEPTRTDPRPQQKRATPGKTASIERYRPRKRFFLGWQTSQGPPRRGKAGLECGENRAFQF